MENRRQGELTHSSTSLLLKYFQIQYDTKIELGSGSGGTIVFKLYIVHSAKSKYYTCRGTYAEREVAVKRVLKQNVQLATREVDALLESDSDDNVIRYFDSVRYNLMVFN